MELGSLDYSGILHLAGPEALTRWEFGLGILALHNKTPTGRIVPSTREESGLTRPRDLTLNIGRGHQRLPGLASRGWIMRVRHRLRMTVGEIWLMVVMRWRSGRCGYMM